MVHIPQYFKSARPFRRDRCRTSFEGVYHADREGSDSLEGVLLLSNLLLFLSCRCCHKRGFLKIYFCSVCSFVVVGICPPYKPINEPASQSVEQASNLSTSKCHTHTHTHAHTHTHTHTHTPPPPPPPPHHHHQQQQNNKNNNKIDNKCNKAKLHKNKAMLCEQYHNGKTFR